MASGPITSWQIEGADFIFLGSKSHCRWWMQSWNTKMLTPWKESYDKCRQRIKKLRHHFANKGPYSQSYGFSSTYVRMGELDHNVSWAPQNWCFWTVVLEKTLEGPLETSRSNRSILKVWLFIGRTGAKAKAPILWPPDGKSWLIEKDPDAGKDWEQEEKGMTEDEMVGWHHWLNGHEFPLAGKSSPQPEAGGGSYPLLVHRLGVTLDLGSIKHAKISQENVFAKQESVQGRAWQNFREGPGAQSWRSWIAVHVHHSSLFPVIPPLTAVQKTPKVNCEKMPTTVWICENKILHF